MPEPVEFKEFDETVRRLCEEVIRWIDSELHEHHWTRGSLDVRYDAGGNSWLSKLQAVTSDGVVVKVSTNEKIMSTIGDWSESRRTVFPNEWYGFLLEIDNRRHCSIDWNYDRDCYSDGTF